MNGFVNLDDKRVPPEEIAEIAIDDLCLLQDLLNGVLPQTQKSARRENCSQALMFMAETWPEVLLPHWAHFIQLMKCENGSSKYVAVYVIASLTQAKPEQFEPYFENYFSLLEDPSVMVASHAALNAGKIGLAVPSLQERITRRLLSFSQSDEDSNRAALVKAYILQALELLHPSSPLQQEILEFVKAQRSSPSPKTQKIARELLKKFDKT